MQNDPPLSAASPSRVLRSALGAALLLLALPLILLVLAALLTGVVVLGVFAAMVRVASEVGVRLPRSDGRENVRVVPPPRRY
jgi:hypothetical protein